MLRVRKYHTCISLQLNREDASNVCDKCLIYHQRQNGIGRRLSKGAVPKCEKPWYYDTSKQHRSLAKKYKFINLLTKYNYKIIEDDTKKDVGSRLCTKDYRTNWANKKSPIKKATSSMITDEKTTDSSDLGSGKIGDQSTDIRSQAKVK